jgi:hypothetical protein
LSGYDDAEFMMKVLASGAFVALILGLTAGRSLRPTIDPAAAAGPRLVAEAPAACTPTGCLQVSSP